MHVTRRCPATNPLSRPAVCAAIVVHVLAPLLMGASVYVIHRSTDLLLWRWTTALGADDLLASLRTAASPIAASMPAIVSNLLPAISWSYAFVVAVGLVWVGAKKQRTYVGIVVATVLASEAAQGVGLLPGTFDWQDVGAYLLGLSLGFVTLERYWNEPANPRTQHTGVPS
jgi:hypothetical protein